jgi:hypothetical protein
VGALTGGNAMPEGQKPKKKRTTPTHTSNEVKKRYCDKTYHRILVSFRFDSDQDLLDAIREKQDEMEVNCFNKDGSPVTMQQAIKAIMRGE